MRRHFHNTELLARLGGGTFAIVLDALDIQDRQTTRSNKRTIRRLVLLLLLATLLDVGSREILQCTRV